MLKECSLNQRAFGLGPGIARTASARVIVAFGAPVLRHFTRHRSRREKTCNPANGDAVD